MAYILVLEEFRRAKEQRRRLLGVERLAGIEEVHDPRKEGPAFPRANGGVIEDPCLLYYRRLVVVICAEAGLLIFFGYERHVGEVGEAEFCGSGDRDVSMRRTSGSG